MKFAALTAIAHNLADSLASGCSLLTGFYDLDVFGEAARSPGGVIEIDFLAGRCTRGLPSELLSRAAAEFAAQALPRLCASEGIEVSRFLVLNARFGSDPVGSWCDVTVENESGRRRTDRYVGIPLRRVRTLDRLGRVRTQRG